MNHRTVIVTVYSRHDSSLVIHEGRYDLALDEVRHVYGDTAQSVAHTVAGEFCDSGSVTYRMVGERERIGIGRQSLARP